MIRKATKADFDAICKIYDAIHTEEEAGRTTTGWQRAIYPTSETARRALAADDMFVLEDGGKIAACARINQEQVDCYEGAPWHYDAPADQVMVLHTLVVDPAASHKGLGTTFLRFYEDFAKDHNCPYLRLDTNERNTRARAFYKKLGYWQVDIRPCAFNGIPGVNLVLLEKKL